MSEFNHDLFVSYSGADADWVQRLAAHLELEQWKVWIYEWDIQPAEIWQDAIEEAIRASRKLAVVLSPEAVRAPWVKLECDAMIDLAVSGDLGRFVPLLVKDCDVPLFIRQFQRIDFRDPHQFMIKLNDLISFLRDQSIPRDIKASTGADEWKPSTSQELRNRIHKILAYLDEIGMLQGFVCNWLELYWKELKGDKRITLIQRYAWPGREDEGLRELFQEAQQYLAQLGVR